MFCYTRNFAIFDGMFDLNEMFNFKWNDNIGLVHLNFKGTRLHWLFINVFFTSLEFFLGI